MGRYYDHARILAEAQTPEGANVKLLGFSFTQDDGIWRTLMVQNNTYYLDTNGNITLSSPKAIESMQMVKRLIDEGLVLNTVNWDTGIRAHKNGEIAISFNGGWWGGTIKDQIIFYLQLHLLLS